MSTVHFRSCLALAILMALAPLPAAASEPLKPFKDALFSAQPVLESRDGGAFTIIDYNEMRDINGRDQIPERRVKPAYVDLGIKRRQANETVDSDGRTIEVFRAGKATNSAFTVIFVHGRGGDRRLGANDFTFGGNFNRLKNLAVDNDGTYYAPSVKTFDSDGVAGVAALIDHAAQVSPGGRIVLSCASMGSFICWGISREAKTVTKLAGMVILGGATDPDFPASAFHTAKLPLFLTHGSRDSVYAAAGQIGLYDRLHKAGYPVRFTLYEGGSHGTPVRMTDWRTVLNWILGQ